MYHAFSMPMPRVQETIMTFADRLVSLYNDIAKEFNAVNATAPQQRANYLHSPNAQPETTPPWSPPQSPITPHVAAGVPVTGPIDQFASVTLNGSGNGTAQIGPTRVRETWGGIIASVSVATAVNNASCSIYAGSTVQSATLIGSTSSGSTGATCTLPNPIPSGYQIFAVWTGGDAGQVATVHVTATYAFGRFNA